MQPTCDWCSLPVEGRYLKYGDGLICCTACKSSRAECVICKRAARDPEERGDSTFCGACLAKVGTCHTCEVPLVGKYFTNRLLPDKRFCEPCIKSLTVCDFCGVPVTAGGVKYPDGRDSCAACQRTAVVEQSVIRHLEDEARVWLWERLRVRGRPVDEVPLALVGADRIAEVQGKAFASTPGFDGRERGLFAAKKTVYRQGVEFVKQVDELAIYIESGLPRHEAFGTVVHELVHLWQYDNYPKKPVHRQYVEGLAVWAQYHALLESGATREAEMLEKNPDPIYGGGFRLVREVEGDAGFDGTLSRLVLRIGGRWQAPTA